MDAGLERREKGQKMKPKKEKAQGISKCPFEKNKNKKKKRNNKSENSLSYRNLKCTSHHKEQLEKSSRAQQERFLITD